MRQVADCVPYQGKNTHFCLGMAQAISASIIYGIRFRPFSNNIAKQPTATTWILSAYISFCGTNCATLGSKHPFSPWCGTQSRTRPLHKSRPAICEPQPSPRPCQSRAWYRAKSARRRNNNIYRRTSKTHTAHVLVIRPHEHTMLAQALAAERPLMNPPNLTSPLPGLASPAGPAGNERITTTCLASDCTAISQLWQTRTRSRYAGKAR